MDDSDLHRIKAWLIAGGLAGTAEDALLQGFCERCQAAGLELSRAIALIDTLHPIYEGCAFRWRNDGIEEKSLVEYGRTDEGAAAADWRRTAFHHLLTTDTDEVRRRIGHGEPTDFSMLDTLKAEGHTDYVAMIHRLARDGFIGGMDCVYSSWVTRRPGGFEADDLVALRRLVPALALAIKCGSLARIASTLVEVYLGRDAGLRVLSGRISRGVADRISAVLWFSDLHSYTAIADSAAPAEIIPFLNDYAELVIAAIHEAGGDVLKLIGDGTLAIFKAEDPGDACRSALRAAQSLRRNLMALNQRRAAENRPVTSVYLGLHIGEVFYGNIGSDERLDFTVVGPAVNEVSRIASMCRQVDRSVLLSDAFAAAAPAAERADLVSVGRYALRGVSRAQELFTLDPSLI
ncbi:MAG: adenylate/guanylate cyclase domain-containing protein [Hypericibacter sp.]